MSFRKLLSLLLCTVILVFTGCSTNTNNQITEQTPESSKAANEQESIPSTEPTSNQVEADNDFLRQYGVESLPDKVELPSCAVKTDIKHLYRLNIDMGEMQTIASVTVENDVIFCYDPFMGEDYLYSLTNGKQMAKVGDQGEFMMTGRLDTGGFWTIRIANLETTFYDIAGNATVMRQAEKAGLSYFGIVTKDGKYEIYDNDKGEITIYDIENGTQQSIAGADEYYQFVCEQGSACIFSNDKGDLVAIYPEIAKKEVLYSRSEDKSDRVMNTDGQFFYMSTEDSEIIKPVSDLSKKITVKKQNKEETMLEFSHGIMVESDYSAPNTVRFYNLNTSEVIGELEAKDNMQYGVVRVLDNGYALISIMEDDRLALFLYDLVSERETEKFEMTVEEISEKEETNPIVKEMEDTYGIDIYYGEDVRLPYSAILAEPLLSQDKMDTGIKALKDFLGRLPKGMTQEIYQDDRNGLNIYLSGTIEYVEGEDGAIGGYTSVLENGRIMIMVDCSESYEVIYSYLANSFAHAIENKIQSVIDQTEIDYFEGWNQLVTSESPIDDRAALFEKMMTPENGKINAALDDDQMKKEARYYSLMLRACFESCQQADTLEWEQYIGNIDKDEFANLIKF